MPRITKFSPYVDKNGKERVAVHLDGKWAIGVRARIFPALKLNIGDETTVETLNEQESFFFKNHYGPKAWEAEKKRIQRVLDFLKWTRLGLTPTICGFGADSLEILKEHPKVPGEPDMAIQGPDGQFLMHLEVTGTDYQRGTGFWVRPDKIACAQRHPDQESWVALHYARAGQEGKERLLFFKIDPHKTYEATMMNIRGAGEPYVVLGEEDVIDWRAFAQVLTTMSEASPASLMA